MENENDIIFDPTADIMNSISTQNNKIHIRIKQRNGRKSNTTVEKLPEKIDLAVLLKKMKKKFHCNGAVKQSPTEEKYIQLFGDQRLAIKKFLLEHSVVDETNVVVHGY